VDGTITPTTIIPNLARKSIKLSFNPPDEAEKYDFCEFWDYKCGYILKI
jgi:hypothetical protein